MECALASTKTALETKNFIEADSIINSQIDNEILEACQKLKVEFVQADLDVLAEKHGEPHFDKEKAEALAVNARNLLVQARAGSERQR